MKWALAITVAGWSALSCGQDPASSGVTSGGGARASGGTDAFEVDSSDAVNAGGSTAGGAAGGAYTGASSASAGAGGYTPGEGGASGSNADSGARAGAGGATGSEPIVPPLGFKLVWHDEFDVDGAPSSANYNFERGFQRNEEAQWYQSANASVQGGMLVIEARQETVTNPNYTGSGDWKTTRKTAEYTSSSLTTNGKQTFQYGHFEMRARIPTDAGMWPAWWTLGVKGEWPSNGEIDIMEFYKNTLLANVACGTATRYEAKWESSTIALSALGANWASNFHVWTMDWDERSIVLSVDGKALHTSTLSSMLNSDGTSPFKQKVYLLVNLAIGGENGGDPSKTKFPKRYEVDYLRVFQKQ